MFNTFKELTNLDVNLPDSVEDFIDKIEKETPE